MHIISFSRVQKPPPTLPGGGATFIAVVDMVHWGNTEVTETRLLGKVSRLPCRYCAVDTSGFLW